MTTTAAIIAAWKARATHVATLPRTQLIRGVDMTKAITWGPDRAHFGSPECPADARDVPCSIFDCVIGAWLATTGCVKGHEWGEDAWKRAAAYRLPAVVTAPADPVRDALVEALEEVTNGENWRSGRKFDPNSGNFDLSKQRAALALALAKGEKT